MKRLVLAADAQHRRSEFPGSGRPTRPFPGWTFHFTSATDVAFSGSWTVISGTGRFSDSSGGGSYQGTASVASNTGDLHLNGSVSDTGRN